MIKTNPPTICSSKIWNINRFPSLLLPVLVSSTKKKLLNKYAIGCTPLLMFRSRSSRCQTSFLQVPVHRATRLYGSLVRESELRNGGGPTRQSANRCDNYLDNTGGFTLLLLKRPLIKHNRCLDCCQPARYLCFFSWTIKFIEPAPCWFPDKHCGGAAPLPPSARTTPASITAKVHISIFLYNSH